MLLVLIAGRILAVHTVIVNYFLPSSLTALSAGKRALWRDRAEHFLIKAEHFLIKKVSLDNYAKKQDHHLLTIGLSLILPSTSAWFEQAFP